MANLKLASPKKIQQAVSANLQCVMPLKSDVMNSVLTDEIATITPEVLQTKLALGRGFKLVHNLQGGMLRWNELRFPFVRDMGGS
jgi:hypothetical protein